MSPSSRDAEGALELAQVVVGGAVEQPDLADGLRRAQVGCDRRLDPLLGLVGELGAVAAEELDAVVLPRVVGGGDDDGEVEAEAPDQDRRGRRGDDARDERVSPALRDAGGERALEHRPGLARVADDQDLWALGSRLVGGGAAERHGKLSRQSLAGDPADAVGAESRLAKRCVADGDAEQVRA